MVSCHHNLYGNSDLNVRHGNGFSRFKNGRRHPVSGQLHNLCANKPAHQCKRPLIENHADNFLEIIVKFLKCLALTVFTRKARDIAYIEPVSGQRSTTAV